MSVAICTAQSDDAGVIADRVERFSVAQICKLLA